MIKKLHSVIDSLELPEEMRSQIVKYVNELERKTGKRFGDPKNPMLVSVRSGGFYAGYDGYGRQPRA